ncbi:glycosyltransferase family 2 protein [Corallococcus carmarthensis]|uniref:Glycosyltransferase n=1 Tax=Corallococcus carmarthensis TaxID=2316728 RepID=A0A3A8K5Y5_9BACT|nr:glycosyltransferase family 2 protein [Corallococcus carmarthensis]NOK22553.1 glycosyltransferase family 2 protein [Corallococcus carmarthensis]RKG97193.1 glycosyltransferase [Corallococcus carmarthensis]
MHRLDLPPGPPSVDARTAASASRDATDLTLDIVIPVYNEEEMLDLLLGRLAQVFAPEVLARQGVASVRFILVDDGSRDATARLLAERIRGGLQARLIRLSRNFGHQGAVCAGLDHADADLVSVMDADLQDPPEVVWDMLAAWRQGADVAFGRRRRRQGNVLKRLGYWGFYRLVAFLSEINLPLDTGDFCLMDRGVVSALRQLPENLRFSRGLRAWVGFQQVAVPFDRPARAAGEPKYTWSKLYRLATDGIASMSTRPLQAAQLASFLFGVLTLLFLFLLVGFSRHLDVPRPFLFAYVLIATGNAVLAFCLYILGAYVGRTYLEVKGRPPYVVMERVEPRARQENPHVPPVP